MLNFFKREKQEEGEKYKKPYYSFRSVKADKVFDLAQDGQNKGSLIIWEGHAGQNQTFTLVRKGNGYCIKCKKDNAYLTVESPADGARVYAAQKNEQANQTFRIEQKQPGSKQHVIYTFCGKVLDVAEASKKNGARIVQWQFNGNDNQLWNFCDPKNITSSSSEID